MDVAGKLFLVATPIGNMEDIAPRALKTLEESDIIAAEDTRRTMKLLNHFGIKNTLVSYYEHNKAERGNYLIRQMLEGKQVALVSDAGTPGISDPGEDLVRLAAENGITVAIIPGPSAVIAGLVLSGLPTGRFCFEGFLPVNKRLRGERLKSLMDEPRTLVFYEAPHKLAGTLRDMREAFGNRRIAIARELTKKFEEIRRCTLDEAIEMYGREKPRGEFVLVLEGAGSRGRDRDGLEEWRGISLKEHVEMYMDKGFDKKQAMKMVAGDRKISKREVYESTLEK